MEDKQTKSKRCSVLGRTALPNSVLLLLRPLHRNAANRGEPRSKNWVRRDWSIRLQHRPIGIYGRNQARIAGAVRRHSGIVLVVRDVEPEILGSPVHNAQICSMAPVGGGCRAQEFDPGIILPADKYDGGLQAQALR